MSFATRLASLGGTGLATALALTLAASPVLAQTAPPPRVRLLRQRLHPRSRVRPLRQQVRRPHRLRVRLPPALRRLRAPVP